MYTFLMQMVSTLRETTTQCGGGQSPEMLRLGKLLLLESMLKTKAPSQDQLQLKIQETATKTETQLISCMETPAAAPENEEVGISEQYDNEI